MKYILYIVAAILIIAWAIGFFAFNVGAVIHVLLVIALISILVKIISDNRNKN